MRIGNGAADQLQLDIYGEAIDSIFLADSYGISPGHQGWQDLARIIDWLCEHWDQPDEGIWETRGGQRNFTYGRFQAWVALDRAIRLATGRGRANLVRWTDVRDQVYAQIMEPGWNPKASRGDGHASDRRDDVLPQFVGAATTRQDHGQRARLRTPCSLRALRIGHGFAGFAWGRAWSRVRALGCWADASRRSTTRDPAEGPGPSLRDNPPRWDPQ